MATNDVTDAGDATFQADVLDASRDTPIIVDFWAPWCGPCRVIGPVLERLVEEHAGRVRLVKVNVDENPVVAGRFGIQSIPAVFAFKDGSPVNQFLGAIPEPEVRAFVQALLPSEADRLIASAALMLAAGNADAARAALEEAVAKDPKHLRAALELADLLFAAGELDRAAELAGRFPTDPAAKRMLGRIQFQPTGPAADRAALEARIAGDAEDAAAHYELGALLASDEAWEPALEHLLTAVRLDRTLDDDGARRRMIDLFNILGAEHPLTRDYRRQLSTAIF